MLWQACQGAEHLTCIQGEAYRLVESQQQVATLSYVDTLEEQALLEEMIEEVKPPYPEHTGLHYLLRMPFRYPPLRWGSRFGRSSEPSLFYGALSVTTVLAESAFYRFVFWQSMEATPPKPQIRTQHMLFNVGYKTLAGVRLHQAPFRQHKEALTHPQSYDATQTLGRDMRDAGVKAFEYTSARDKQQGLCVGIFTPNVFTHKQPSHSSRWLCQLTADQVSFKQIDNNQIIDFALQDFLYNGRLARPAG